MRGGSKIVSLAREEGAAIAAACYLDAANRHVPCSWIPDLDRRIGPIVVVTQLPGIIVRLNDQVEKDMRTEGGQVMWLESRHRGLKHSLRPTLMSAADCKEDTRFVKFTSP